MDPPTPQAPTQQGAGGERGARPRAGLVRCSPSALSRVPSANQESESQFGSSRYRGRAGQFSRRFSALPTPRTPHTHHTYTSWHAPGHSPHRVSRQRHRGPSRASGVERRRTSESARCAARHRRGECWVRIMTDVFCAPQFTQHRQETGTESIMSAPGHPGTHRPARCTRAPPAACCAQSSCRVKLGANGYAR